MKTRYSTTLIVGFLSFVFPLLLVASDYTGNNENGGEKFRHEVTQSFEASKVREIIISGTVGEVRLFPLKGKNIEIRSVFGASHQKIADASKLQAELKNGKLSIESFQPKKLLEKSGTRWWSTLEITISEEMNVDIKTDNELELSGFSGKLNALRSWGKIYYNAFFNEGKNLDIEGASLEKGIRLIAKNPKFWKESRKKTKTDMKKRNPTMGSGKQQGGIR